jgi:hypothetical protein
VAEGIQLVAQDREDESRGKEGTQERNKQCNLQSLQAIAIVGKNNRKCEQQAYEKVISDSMSDKFRK